MVPASIPSGRRLAARTATLASTALLAGATAWAVPGRTAPLSVEDLFREPHVEGTRPRDPILSPDERWVAFAWNAHGLEAPLDLWVAAARSGNPRALTTFPPDPHADSLRTAQAHISKPDDPLPGKTLPRYFDENRTDYRVGSIVWAPDSKRIAFTARGDVYVARVAGGLTRLTATRSFEGELAWSPNGRYLAFTRDNAVWALEVDRGRELQLSSAGGDSIQPSSLQWSPDSRFLAFMGRDDRGLRDLAIPYYLGERVSTGSAKEGYPDNTVRIVDARWLEGKTRLESRDPFPVHALRLGAGKHAALGAMAWSPNGRWLALTDTSADMRTRRLLIAPPESTLARTVYTESDSAWIEEYDWVIADHPLLEWAPDSRSVLTLSERSGFRHVLRIPVDGRAPEPLTAGKWEVGWAHWLAGGREIVLLDSRARTTGRQLEILDIAHRSLRPLATGLGMSIHPSMGNAGRVVVYEHSRFDQPSDLYAIEARPDAKPVQLTRSVPATFAAVSWIVPELVEFPSHDGLTLHGLVYRPVGFDPARRYPAVVFVHGAGILQNVVDGWTFYSPNYKFHTLLAQRGYVVFEVDYRGSLGYGRDFRAGVYMHLGGKDLDDELAGLDYLDRLGFVDMSRVGIYGGSYGGFMALMALFTTPDRWACGAALRFVADWENYHRGNPWYCVQRLGTPQAHPEAYWRSSPIHFAGNLKKPLLLLHGMRDDNVHFQDAAQLTERLIRYGKDFELMMYPRESHGFTAPASWIDEYRRIAEFFDAHLQPSAAGSARSAIGASGAH